jgi:hypothetical protein
MKTKSQPIKWHGGKSYDVVLSTADAVNSGQQDKCRQLNSDQIEFVIRLEELAAKQSR